MSALPSAAPAVQAGNVSDLASLHQEVVSLIGRTDVAAARYSRGEFDAPTRETLLLTVVDREDTTFREVELAHTLPAGDFALEEGAAVEAGDIPSFPHYL
jgi:hypothetical protein